MVGFRCLHTPRVWRLPCAIGIALVLAIPMDGGVRAQTPSADDLAIVVPVVHAMTESNNPRQVLAELPEDTRHLVTEYLKVDSLEPKGWGGPTTPHGSTESCQQHQTGYVGRNAYGRELWTFTSKTEWCWADGLITTVPVFTTSAEFFAPLWEFAGHMEERESGGKGEPLHFDEVDAIFQLCPENRTSCVQDVRLWVRKAQDGSSGSRSSQSGSGNGVRIPESSSSFSVTEGIDSMGHPRLSPDLGAEWIEHPGSPVTEVSLPLLAGGGLLGAGWILRWRSSRGNAAWALGTFSLVMGAVAALLGLVLGVPAFFQ